MHVYTNAPHSEEMAIIVLIAMLTGIALASAILLYYEKKHRK